MRAANSSLDISKLESLISLRNPCLPNPSESPYSALSAPFCSSSSPDCQTRPRFSFTLFSHAVTVTPHPSRSLVILPFGVSGSSGSNSYCRLVPLQFQPSNGSAPLLFCSTGPTQTVNRSAYITNASSLWVYCTAMKGFPPRL